MKGNHHPLRKYFPLLLISVLFLTSCGSRKNLLFNTGNEKKIPNVPVYELQKGDTTAYRGIEQILKPGDALQISNIKNESLISGTSNPGETITASVGIEFVIKENNYVTLPIIGNIKLGGKTILDAQDTINQLYGKAFLETPQLLLKVTNMKVTLWGEFNTNGEIKLEKNEVNLVEVLGKAGGLNNRANKKRIKIIRGDIKNPQILIVNLEDIKSLADDRLYLHNGDILYAEPKGGYQTIDRFGSTSSLIGLGLSAVNIYFLLSNLLK